MRVRHGTTSSAGPVPQLHCHSLCCPTDVAFTRVMNVKSRAAACLWFCVSTMTSHWTIGRKQPKLSIMDWCTPATNITWNDANAQVLPKACSLLHTVASLKKCTNVHSIKCHSSLLIQLSQAAAQEVAHEVVLSACIPNA